MSYRAFKRLLGQSSLERKCRFMFGSGVVVLITLSFWLYDHLTVHLAYDQAVNACRLLVQPTQAQHCLSKDAARKNDAGKPAVSIESVFLREPGQEYQYHFLADKGEDAFERDLYANFMKG